MEVFFALKFEIFLLALAATPVFIRVSFIRNYLLKISVTRVCSPDISSIALCLIFVFDFNKNFLGFGVTVLAFLLFFRNYAVAICMLTKKPELEAKQI